MNSHSSEVKMTVLRAETFRIRIKEDVICANSYETI